MSVIVAAAPGFGDPARCASALLAQAVPGDEILWVGAPVPVPGVVDVAVDGPGGRGAMYRAGLDRASRRSVAFTDAATVVEPGWRRAVGEALASGAAVVGGPVLPGPRRKVRRFAGFIVEYGPHALAPFSSATFDVASNNVAYDRVALDRVLEAGEPVWKATVDARLTAGGTPPVIEERMCVVSTKDYTWADLLAGRAAHGRQYGAQQAASMSRSRRALGAARCIALPAVAYGRLCTRFITRRDLRRSFALASPAVMLSLIAWSVGEAAGLCTATGARSDIL